MHACKHDLLELSTAGQGRINNMTTLQTRACALDLPVFLSETWHRTLPELLIKTCNMQQNPNLTFKNYPKVPNDLSNHYLGQGKSSLQAGVYQVLCAAYSHH